MFQLGVVKKNIEDNSMERTAELLPAESETLLRGHVWQQPENEKPCLWCDQFCNRSKGESAG